MALPLPSAGAVAVVTGASSGIGEQFAHQLVTRGYRVVVTARRADRLQKLCAQLGGDEHAVAVGADLAVAEDRDRLAARIDELDAEVDILVNNAGVDIYCASTWWIFGSKRADTTSVPSGSQPSPDATSASTATSPVSPTEHTRPASTSLNQSRSLCHRGPSP
jgi:NAD(P)-dependent dehydrogenase (short-subunit alcohol dehydrogenase family)